MDNIAADLPSVSDVLEDADPKLLDDAQDDEHVYIRREVFTSSLETIGIANQWPRSSGCSIHGRLIVTLSALQRGKYQRPGRDKRTVLDRLSEAKAL